MGESDKAKATSAEPRGKFRENVDAFAIAILMAVLMKFFALEAYQIPTSSMQPTMMGHKATGVFDRIIVDKIRYEIFEPQRWDIAVFRYPIRRKQNYVKRIVGLPGDRLRIAGGNIYRLVGDDPGDPDDLEVLRPPDLVQEAHLKQVFPLRVSLSGATRALGTAFRGVSGEWEEGDDFALTVTTRGSSSRTHLSFSDFDGGLVNRLYDGYALGIAQSMRDEAAGIQDRSVQDARISFALTPEETPERFSIELTVHHMTGSSYRFELVVENGQGRLRVHDGSKVALESDPFDFELPAGEATDVAFAHVDDRCRAWIDGDLAGTLDTDAYKSLSPLFPSTSREEGRVKLSIKSVGGKKLTYSDIVVERDLHYLQSSRPGNYSVETIDVPGPDEFDDRGYYFMLGDNTLQSVDSRDWTSLTIGVTEDGKVVDPRGEGVAKMTGNLRAISLHEEPDPDENPVIILSEGKVVFTDDVGEVYVLDGTVNIDKQSGKEWGRGGPWFLGDEGPWEAPTGKVSFVPRHHILGRPVLNFWPWDRIGLIR